ncbi:hypothetical protein ACTXG7_02230 [Mycolicibacterium sp. Dal123E01]|uniref:hypothetical protein n=1 Tax=Mycolicibacterium sp. Dal123E01 TaxID=3457578 RepID=UPI00403EA9C5
MTVQHKRTAVRLALVGMALGLVVAGCGKDEDSSSKSTSASSSAASSASSSAAATSTSGAAAPAAADLTALLMKPESIPPTPAGPFVGDKPEVDSSATPSVTQTYQSGGNVITALVLLAPDPEQAAGSIEKVMTSDAITSKIKGPLAPAPNVNKTAMVVNGTSADGSASMSVLAFSEGRAVAQLTFVGKLGDPVSADYLDTVGVIQLDAIQQNLSKAGG